MFTQKLFAKANKGPSRKELAAELERTKALLREMEAENTLLRAQIVNEKLERALEKLEYYMELDAVETKKEAVEKQLTTILNIEIGIDPEEDIMTPVRGIVTPEVKRQLTRQSKGMAILPMDNSKGVNGASSPAFKPRGLMRQSRGFTCLPLDIEQALFSNLDEPAFDSNTTASPSRALTRQSKGLATLPKAIDQLDGSAADSLTPSTNPLGLTRQSKGSSDLRKARLSETRGLPRQDATASDLHRRKAPRCRLTCGICEEQYGLQSGRVPRSLECGHTMCETCCESIQTDGQIRCPFDRHPTRVPVLLGPHALPKNYVVLQLTQK